MLVGDTNMPATGEVGRRALPSRVVDMPEFGTFLSEAISFFDPIVWRPVASMRSLGNSLACFADDLAASMFGILASLRRVRPVL